MKQNGFTLMELMITVVIVAILAAVAIPSYSSYVQKSRRSEAFNALASVINAMEKFRLSQNVYPASITALNGTITSHGLVTDGVNWESREGNYAFAVMIDAGGQPSGVSATAQAAQASDDTCDTLTLLLNGTKGATDAASADSTESCWPD